MTSITFGGGPTLQQRMDFAGLKEGTHVPGYRGYCPQIKYRVGKTYGQDTHELSQSFDSVKPLPPTGPVEPKNPIKNFLPKSTGDNKYTETMVPGYTGYVPRRPFKFGGTYKVDCDVCIDEHMTNQQHHNGKATDMLRLTKSAQPMQPKRFDPEVRDHLNTYRDLRPGRPLMMEDKRTGTEPPMPGYHGYIPRIYTTEEGLGCRYHDMTKNGLSLFKREQDFQNTIKSAPITINRSTHGAAGPTYNKRLYVNDGMIPKYTGFLPQGRYRFGNTYGDTSRSLEVCNHEKTCFGEYNKTRTGPLLSSIC